MINNEIPYLDIVMTLENVSRETFSYFLQKFYHIWC
jgi:hypothetical protein